MTRSKKSVPVEAAIPLESSVEQSQSTGSKPTVFISHDSRDADLAEEFGNLLTDVSGGILKPFCSSDRKGTRGIDFGEEWFRTIMVKLNNATDVVALLTQHSIDRPWILYEAGVAKGKLGTPVFGVAVGVPLEKASSGPFAQFQNCGDDDDSLTKLALQLIRRNPDASPREEAVRRHVAAFREKITSLMKKHGTGGHADGAPKVDETTIAKLFEEVKVMFRSLPDNLEEKLGRSIKRGIGRREFDFHPMMLDELFFMTNELGLGPNSYIFGWLIFISFFRDNLPWFYELGMQFYHALESGNKDAIATTAENIRLCMKICRRGPFMEMFMGIEDPRAHRLLRQLPEMVDHYMERTVKPRKLQIQKK